MTKVTEEKTSKFRGYLIEEVEGVFVFCDTRKPVADTWKDRSCGYCGKENTKEGFDGCVGKIPNARNDCGGHGKKEDEYIQFCDGRRLSGEVALKIMEQE